MSIAKPGYDISEGSAVGLVDSAAGLAVGNDEGEVNWTSTDNSFYFESTNQTGELTPAAQFVNHNFTATEDTRYPPDMIIFGAVCMILFAQFAIVGNFVSIWALSKSKKLRRVTTALVVNICVADFLQSCSNLISAAVIVKKRHWNGGDRTCKSYNILLIYFATVSMVALITMTVNRFILIVYPRFYRSIFSKRNAAIIIALDWIFPGVLMLSIYFKVWGMFGYDRKTGECAIIDSDGNTEPYTFIAGYFFPLALFIICYAKILYVVRKSERNTKRHRSNIMSYIAHLGDKYLLQEQAKESGHTNYKNLRNRKEWRIFQMIMVIIVGYFLCFIPLAVMKILRQERDHPRVYIVCHLGIHFANVLNPIIYIVMSEDYRKAYKELLFCSSDNR